MIKGAWDGYPHPAQKEQQPAYPEDFNNPLRLAAYRMQVSRLYLSRDNDIPGGVGQQQVMFGNGDLAYVAATGWLVGSTLPDHNFTPAAIMPTPQIDMPTT